MCCGNLHLLVYSRSPAIERPTEYVGESQHVVYLVGIIATAGCVDQIRAGGKSRVARYLRIGIGKGKNDGTLRHRGKHIGRHHIGNRKAKECVGTAHGVGKRAHTVVGHGKLFFLLVQPGAPLVYDATAVAHHDIILRHS